jgi:hypothetical protein
MIDEPLPLVLKLEYKNAVIYPSGKGSLEIKLNFGTVILEIFNS